MKNKSLFKKITIIATIAIMTTFAVLMTACDKPKTIPKDIMFDDSNYTTTFFDDFNSNTLNRDVWRIETFESKGNLRRGGYYSENNVLVEDGKLKIRTNYQTDGKNGEGWYTGWVDMAPQKSSASGYTGFAQKYGYFEVKCMAPPIQGAWSAAWMMPAEGVAFSPDDVLNTASDGCEIDIMESPGYASNGSYTQHVLHCDDYNNVKSQKSDKFQVDNMYTTFHTYAVEWTENEFKFYIDGYLTWTTKYVFKNIELGVSHVLEYLILSVEVGNKDNSWAGLPDKNDKSKNYDYIIDSVRIMQKK